MRSSRGQMLERGAVRNLQLLQRSLERKELSLLSSPLARLHSQTACHGPVTCMAGAAWTSGRQVL